MLRDWSAKILMIFVDHEKFLCLWINKMNVFFVFFQIWSQHHLSRSFSSSGWHMVKDKQQLNLHTTYHRNPNALSCSGLSRPIADGNRDSLSTSIKRCSGDASSPTRSYGLRDGVWNGMSLESMILIAVITCIRTGCAGSRRNPTPFDGNGPTSPGILTCMSCVRIVNRQETKSSQSMPNSCSVISSHVVVNVKKTTLLCLLRKYILAYKHYIEVGQSHHLDAEWLPSPKY